MKANQNQENYQERMAALTTLAENERYNAIDCIIADMLAENERVWSINRRWKCHGTWRVSLWVNQYTWGRDLAEKINSRCYIVTYDEDKKFVLTDFEELLTTICTDYVASIAD